MKALNRWPSKWSIGTFKSSATVVIVAFVILTASMGCSREEATLNQLSPQAEQEFQQRTNLNRMDNELELELLSPPPDEAESGILRIMIMNRSDATISFPADYGVRIFVIDEETVSWQEIPNTVQYYGDGELLEPHDSETSNWVTVVAVSPDTSSVTGESLLRILVAGNIVNEDGDLTNQNVGAFTTLPLDEQFP